MNHGDEWSDEFDHNILNESQAKETPEYQLWRAVLLEAVLDVERGRMGLDTETKAHRRMLAMADDAVQWIASPSRDEGAFLWICDMLKLEPSYFRRMIAAKLKIKRSGARYRVTANPHGRGRPSGAKAH